MQQHHHHHQQQQQQQQQQQYQQHQQTEQQRGRSSRASSTSSLGREVRCGCQYYQSDSLLPERRVLVGKPPSRPTSRPPSSASMQQPSDAPALRCSEHEYEPIGIPPPAQVLLATAPVVRITDTDVAPVADSDDSIDDRAQMCPALILDGDVILPLDGKIEDLAMEGRELGDTLGDTSEEIESPQELQDRLEERFLSAATPGADSRTTGEVNTSQVDSSALEELPLRRGARGFPQRIKTQAGKLRSRLRAMQRPRFSFQKERQKVEKARSMSSGKSDRSCRTDKRPSRMDRIKSSLPERPNFSLPDRSKFTIKRPNIRLPNALKRVRKAPPSYREEQRSTESTVGSKRNIFDFSTYPRIFDRKSKSRGDYSTSSPKESRTQSTESGTFPRVRKSLGLSAKWAKREMGRFGDANDSRFWRRSSVEETRSSVRIDDQVVQATNPSMPWQVSTEPPQPSVLRGELEAEDEEEEMQYMDYEANSMEILDRRQYPKLHEKERTKEPFEVRGSLSGATVAMEDEEIAASELQRMEEIERVTTEDERLEEEGVGEEEEDEEVRTKPYEASFVPVDPRRFETRDLPSDQEEEEEMEDEEEEYEEEGDMSSALSDREQQSSGSSYDRRRRFATDDKDYFDRRFKVMDLNYSNVESAMTDPTVLHEAPIRPARRKMLRQRNEVKSEESYDVVQPPARPKRERMLARASEEGSDDLFYEERSDSTSRHRVIYQTEGTANEARVKEPLDDIVIVKPARRKSRSSLRSRSQPPIESGTIPRTVSTPETTASSIFFDDLPAIRPAVPPVVPVRRKRTRRQDALAMCNGHKQAQPFDDWLGDNEDVPKATTTDVPLAPVPPKRRSRSRTISTAQDEDRTSHGAESLPEVGFIQEDIPADETDSTKDLSGYAFVEKREKVARVPPPRRRRREKFATTPRPTPPRRPHRAYSTLMSPTRRTEITSPDTMSFEATIEPDSESTPYIEIDDDRKDLTDEEVLSKIQGRPLPAPPRPPRTRREQKQDYITADSESTELVIESTIATQTDPLPDDMIIEEEVTQAKLIVAPSLSGSQVMVSTERIPSPVPPSVPPLPSSQFDGTEESREIRTSSPTSVPRSMFLRREEIYDGNDEGNDEPRPRSLRSTLLSEDTLRVSSLEVGDLKVDRLSVSQLETHKILASEVDAIVISASELKNLRDSMEDASLSPSIIKELIAIRSHLESVSASHARERYSTTKDVDLKSSIKSDIPITNDRVIESSSIANQPTSVDSVVQRETSNPREIDIAADKTASTLLLGENLEIHDVDCQASRTDSTIDATKSSEAKSTLKPAFDIPNLQEEKAAPPSQIDQPSQLTKTKLEEADRVNERADESMINTDQLKESIIQQSQSTELVESSQSNNQRFTENNEEIEIEEKESSRKSRSRSTSPNDRSNRPVRQTASPVRSLPPVISVTPDTSGENVQLNISKAAQPQRAVISYSEEMNQPERDSARDSSQSPIPNLPVGSTHFIAFPASQIPTEFFSLAASAVSSRVDNTEAGILDSSQQLLRALRNAGAKAMRHFLGYIVCSLGAVDSRDKIRDLELALCAFLLVIAALLIVYFSNTRTIMHYHHWDYFNPPQ